MQPRPGISAFGAYRVLREVGRGGMGAVYEVSHPELPRRLALKLILESAADEDALARFEREAQLLGQVRHPNVLVVHAYGRSSGGPYLVTDLVEGESLRQRLFDGPLEPAQAGRIVRDLADAAATVHARGILHRDIKPDNVLLRPDGTPVLLDFGLARELGAQRLTLTGQVVGTPAYMAPEQAAGSSDERSDVYGLGALLYALLAGRAPFEGANPVRVLTMVMTEDPIWPSEERPLVPPELEAVCRVAMAKAPEQRHATARDLRDDLDRWLRGAPTWAGERVPAVALARRRARRRRALLAFGLPGLVLLAAAAAALALKVTAPPPAPEVVASGRLALTLRAPEGVLGAATPITCELTGDDVGPARVRIVGDTAAVDTARVGQALELWLPLEPGAARRVTVLAERGDVQATAEVRVRRWSAREGDHPWPAPPAGVRLSALDGEYVNEKDGSVLLYVPPGVFSMSMRGALATSQYAPPNVTLTRGLLLGKTEVSRAQWARFAEQTRRPLMAWSEPDDALPATHVGRDEARAYCEWAGLRLPSDAEWEFAARGPEAFVYPWGDRLEDGPTPRRAGDVLVPCGTTPRDRSPFGCLDLAGNAQEWTHDLLRPDPGQTYVDPRGDVHAAPWPRGGSYGNHPEDRRGSARTRPEEVRMEEVGFRVARDLQ